VKKHAIALCAVLFAANLYAINAQTIGLSTSKETYHYGDYLEIVISVPEITGDDAVLYIVDSSGKKSTAIPVVIQNLTTTITSPNPFDSLIFKEDKYEIEIQYAGENASVEFELVDAGNVVMPFGSSVVVPQWATSSISDYGLLKFLVDKNIISLQGQTLAENAKVPSWFKTNALWWSEKKISDEEFVNGLTYLLRNNLVLLEA
jgi:hypothetical protein